jgi:GNAT superfamily N-acetyltransferase
LIWVILLARRKRLGRRAAAGTAGNAAGDARAAGEDGARKDSAPTPGEGADPVEIRAVRRGDLKEVIAIDAAITGIEKRAYWQSVLRRYGVAGDAQRQFLVAAAGGRVVGFVIGEVRDWEFGSPPCGWVFAIDVVPDARLGGIATRLLAAICAAFRRAGVTKVRTILARDNTLILSFFRSQGMMAGPFIPLEMDLGGTSPAAR